MLVPEGQTAARALQIRVACAATWGHSDIRAPAAARDCVWVHSPATASICIDVHGSAPVTIEGCAAARGLGQHPGPIWSPGTTLLLRPFGSVRPEVPPRATETTRLKLLVVAMSRSVVLMQLGSVDVYGPCCYQGSCKPSVEQGLDILGLC